MNEKNELTITIPRGKEIDWDESQKQNKIVLKDKQLTYDDICKKLFKDKPFFFTSNIGSIESASPIFTYPYSAANNSTSCHQLECILAKNKLANVAKYLNDKWKPNKGDHAFAITCSGNNFDNKLTVGEYYFGNGENLILFRTQKFARQAIEILGEKTIKLALEPLF